MLCPFGAENPRSATSKSVSEGLTKSLAYQLFSLRGASLFLLSRLSWVRTSLAWTQRDTRRWVRTRAGRPLSPPPQLVNWPKRRSISLRSKSSCFLPKARLGIFRQSDRALSSQALHAMTCPPMGTITPWRDQLKVSPRLTNPRELVGIIIGVGNQIAHDFFGGRLHQTLGHDPPKRWGGPR